ncbi:MFS transporter [Bacillota bacterium]
MEHKWVKNTVLFLSSQAISIFGSYLVQYAIMWHITLTTQSGIMMTIYIMSGLIPTLFISPFAGVWADRFDKKKLIMLSDSFTAFVTLILAVLFYNGYDMLWLLFAASALRSLGTAVQMPVVGAFLPQIVPTDKLMKVNGINSSIRSFIMLASPMLSGLLLSISPIETIFFIDVFTALTAVAFLGLLLKLPVHESSRDGQPIDYFSDLKNGYIYIKSHRYLRVFFLLSAVLFLLISPVSFLTPLQVARSFGAEVWRLTAIEVAFSAGMILGGILIAYWTGFKNKVYTLAVGCSAFALLTATLGLVGNFNLYLIVMMLSGFAMPILDTPAMVLLQQRVDADHLGRVFSVMSMISSTMLPLGMFIYGPLADIIPIEWLLVATGLLMALESLLFIKNKALVAAGEPIEQK